MQQFKWSWLSITLISFISLCKTSSPDNEIINMDRVNYRLPIYVKCLRSIANPSQRKAAAKSIKKDAIVTVGALGALIIGGAALIIVKKMMFANLNDQKIEVEESDNTLMLDVVNRLGETDDSTYNVSIQGKDIIVSIMNHEIKLTMEADLSDRYSLKKYPYFKRLIEILADTKTASVSLTINAGGQVYKNYFDCDKKQWITIDALQ